MRTQISLTLLITFTILFSNSFAFQSDELLVDEDEFEGISATQSPNPPRSSTPPPTITTKTRKRSSDSDVDSKLQFNLEHAFGDSQFSHAGTFSARLKSSSHGAQVFL